MNDNLSINQHKKMIKLSLVMPVYNEQDCIGEVVADWTAELRKHFDEDSYRFIIINDGSRDGTGAILDELTAQYPSLIVVHQQNSGHGTTVYNGYQKAIELGSEYIFQTDSDNQFEAADFDLLWSQREKSRFILGQRKIRYDAWVRLIITRIVIAINCILFWTYIADANIPYRLMRADYLRQLMSRMRFVPFIPNIFLSVIARRSGENLLSIPVKHRERKTGTVSILRWKLVKVCFQCTWQLIKLRTSLWFSAKVK